MPRTSLALAAALISSLTGCADLRNAINPNPDAPRTPTPEEAARNVAFTCTHTSLRHTAYCAKYDASPEGLAVAAKERAAQEVAFAVAKAREEETARAAVTACLVKTSEGEIRTCADKAARDTCRSRQTDDDAFACGKAVREAVAARLNAERSCAQDGKPSACIALPDVPVQKVCVSQCIDVSEKAMHVAAAQEQSACESRYIEADGRSKVACSLPGAVPNVDVVKLNSDVAGALGLLAAGTSPDGVALDDAFKRSDGQFLDALQTACTKTCAERAPNLLAVQKQGPSLVTAYKRCMVEADSRHEARKLAVYETDLYCDYIQKADARCRTASRCDWIEQFSSTTCTYNSPGAGRCQ